MSDKDIGSEAKRSLKEIIDDLFTEPVKDRIISLNKSLDPVIKIPDKFDGLRTDIENQFKSEEKDSFLVKLGKHLSDDKEEESFINKLKALLLEEDDGKETLLNKFKELLTSDEQDSLKSNISKILNDPESNLLKIIGIIHEKVNSIDSITEECERISSSIKKIKDNEIFNLNTKHQDILSEVQKIAASNNEIDKKFEGLRGDLENKINSMQQNVNELKETRLPEISNKADNTIKDINNISKISNRIFYAIFALSIIAFSNLFFVLYIIFVGK